uniref:Uncharacterized protein n=1 Tax=Lepeophtheirus salmonis TaxID=72036 RepID=A0A0K2TLY8_LEPSM
MQLRIMRRSNRNRKKTLKFNKYF